MGGGWNNGDSLLNLRSVLSDILSTVLMTVTVTLHKAWRLLPEALIRPEGADWFDRGG